MTEMSTGSQEGQQDGPLQRAAAFFAGLAIYQLAHFAISAGNFSVERFKIPHNLVGLYINRFIISYRIATFIGNISMTFYGLVGGEGESMRGMSIALRWVDAVTYIIAIISFCSGGQLGHLTLHYWVIFFIEIINGCSFVSAVRIGSKQMPYLLASFPISGIFTSSYHLFFLYIWRRLQLSDTYYWLVVYQKILAIIIATISAILWSAAYSSDNKEKENQETNTFDLTGAWSPILMIALGYGIENMFYPSVAPYKIMGLQRGYKIDVITVITGAIPPLIVLILKNYGKPSPDRKWKGGHEGWHWTWLLFILELICASIFARTLHYPGQSLSRTIRKSPFILGIFTIMYDLSAQALRVVGSNGASRQGGNGTNGQVYPKVDTFATCLYSFTQIVFAFVGDGYLRTYSKYEKDRDNWPTKHYGNRRAFWFWTWNATKVSLSTVKTAFSADLRVDILGKKEYLFIVHEDGPITSHGGDSYKGLVGINVHITRASSRKEYLFDT